MVPRRLGKSWNEKDIHAFNTSSFLEITQSHVGPRSSDSLSLQESPSRSEPTRKYHLFARRKITLVSKKLAEDQAEDEDEYEEAFEAIGAHNHVLHRFLNSIGAGWLGNVLILRVDERIDPFLEPIALDVDKTDERRLAPILWRYVCSLYNKYRPVGRNYTEPLKEKTFTSGVYFPSQPPQT
ncbi:hypothetical protein C8J56DRAFT_63020 [Mycena floridula]|nr:hypothetical protein C8J56DRAFT_63020 [Mycena floridula]